MTLFWLRMNSPVGFPEKPRGPAANPFHAVALQPSLMNGCVAVRQLESTRFLSVEAPQLPLPGFAAKSCECRYVHHGDRRDADERRDDYRRIDTYGLLIRARRDRRQTEQ